MKLVQQKQFAFWGSLFVCMTTLVQFNVSVSIANSGVVAFYGIEFVGIIAYFAILISSLKNRSFLKENKGFLGICILFFSLAAAISIYRSLFVEIDKATLIVFKANLLTIWVIWLMFLFKNHAGDILKAVFWFEAILSAVSLFLILSENLRLSEAILQNAAIRIDVLMILFPMATLFLEKNFKNKYDQAVYWFILLCIFICSIISGSRLNYYIGLPLLLVNIVLLHYQKTRKEILCGLRNTVLVILFSALIIFAAKEHNTILHGLNRILMPSKYENEDDSVILTEIAELDKQIQNSDNEQDQHALLSQKAVLTGQMAQDGNLRDSKRFDVWRQAVAALRGHMLLGCGFKQFPVKDFVYDYSIYMPAHNFILEYLLSYGVVGLLAWLAMLLFLIVKLLAKNGIAYLFRRRMLYIWTIAVWVGAVGFFQPILINPVILFFVYLVIGMVCLLDESGFFEKNGSSPLNRHPDSCLK